MIHVFFGVADVVLGRNNQSLHSPMCILVLVLAEYFASEKGKLGQNTKLQRTGSAASSNILHSVTQNSHVSCGCRGVSPELGGPPFRASALF